MTLHQLYKNGNSILAQADIENAEFDALQLLLYAFGIDHTAYLLNRDSPAEPANEAAFYELIARRSANEPLQYILGSQLFLGNSFSVGEGVLIPRPETEDLVLLCISRIGKMPKPIVFDLCAGSGCIGISIARLCENADVYLFEKYSEALHFLNENVPADMGGRIHVVKADLFTFDVRELPAPDVIVSNPPYIPERSLGTLQQEVLREPMSALNGGADGLAFYREIAGRWMPLLKNGGFAAFECGEDQCGPIGDFMCRFGKIETFADRFGSKRFLAVQK